MDPRLDLILELTRQAMPDPLLNLLESQIDQSIENLHRVAQEYYMAIKDQIIGHKPD